MILRLLIAFILTTSAACAHSKDLAMFYTERGLASAESQWEDAYYKVLNDCKERFAAATPEAQLCFRPVFEVNKLVEAVTEESVMLLRDYWFQRAQGYDPDFKQVARKIQRLVSQLPESARQYFSLVEGL